MKHSVAGTEAAAQVAAATVQQSRIAKIKVKARYRSIALGKTVAIATLQRYLEGQRRRFFLRPISTAIIKKNHMKKPAQVHVQKL